MWASSSAEAGGPRRFDPWVRGVWVVLGGRRGRSRGGGRGEGGGGGGGVGKRGGSNLGVRGGPAAYDSGTSGNLDF